MVHTEGTVDTHSLAAVVREDYGFEVIRLEHVEGLGDDYLVVSSPDGAARSITIGRVTLINATRRGGVFLTFSCETREGECFRAAVTSDRTYFMRY